MPNVYPNMSTQKGVISGAHVPVLVPERVPIFTTPYLETNYIFKIYINQLFYLFKMSGKQPTQTPQTTEQNQTQKKVVRKRPQAYKAPNGKTRIKFVPVE